MLVITIPDKEYWDPVKEEFVNPKGWTLSLEHSLVSISKWEAKWQKPFLSDKEKTPEEIIPQARRVAFLEGITEPSNVGAIFRSAARAKFMRSWRVCRYFSFRFLAFLA